VLQPFKSGAELIREIDNTLTVTPTLWWLGHAGFIIRFANITFYMDPCLSDPPGRTRRIAAPLNPGDIRHADMIFTSHAHAGHLDAPTVKQILEQSRAAKVALPKSAADGAHAQGIPYNRMTTTDSGLRIEYFKDNLYGRVYAVPSAHPTLDWTGPGGFPYLGYVVRFGRWTVYHAGDCAPYPELATHLRKYNVNVAILPIGGNNFPVSDAAQLAIDIGATWIVPMHYGTLSEGTGDEDRESSFIAHMLGHRPELRFRVFQVGEKWTVPEE
jgi:L-ascorbate metabolism protein UlaG (beta-lactamase superfamily)